MKVGYFEKSPNHKSLMRLIAFMASVAGCFLFVNAIAIVWYIVLNNKPDFVGLSITMFGIAGGLFLTSEGFKAMQTRFEDGGGNV